MRDRSFCKYTDWYIKLAIYFKRRFSRIGRIYLRAHIGYLLCRLNFAIMKKTLLLIIVILAAGFRDPGTQDLTSAERKFAINYLNQTRSRLLNDVKGLSAAQLNFVPSDSGWSVAQCVEHITLSEDLIKDWIHGALLAPATPEKKSEEKYTPETLIVIVTDRSHNRAKTGGAWLPNGNFPSTAAAIQAFVVRRDSTIAYLSSTGDDLKTHFIEHPEWGTLDLYQGFVMLSAHCARHTLQLEEVMANPNFPKQ
jgi:DinB superfamily